MKFEHTRVFNFEGAFRGLRNPLNSWNKSDSFFGCIDKIYDAYGYEVAEKYVKKDYPSYYDLNSEDYNKEDERIKLEDEYNEWLLKNGILYYNDSDDNDIIDVAFIGPNDLALAQKLIKAGPEHRKFLRQIFVSVDITAPVYWWKEADTYKIGTTTNSTSSMHTLVSTPITIDCFEIDDYDKKCIESLNDEGLLTIEHDLIPFLEELRQKYIETKDKKYWKELVRWLPQGWLQTRTITMNYENLRNMYFQRKNHKLSEWSGKGGFCEWVESLPYANELILFQ